MPMDRAILWNPPAAPGTTSPGKASSRTPYPIFFQQEAVIALQEHLKSSPTQAIFGFLIGDLYRDPETGVLYSIIDKTLKLSQAIYGDKTEVVVSRLWDRMQEQLGKASASLLGWYHSHPGQGGFLTAHDVETHEKFFTDPWHVAVLVAAEAGGVTGRFFRATQGNADWHKTPLPFYELLQPESIKPDGKKRSFILWRNYKPYGPTLTGPKPKPPEPPPPPPPPPSPPAPKPTRPPKAAEPEEEEAEVAEEQSAERGFRIMRSSADDIPVVKTSADDEPAPPPVPTPPPPPPKTRPAAPVFVPDEPPPAPPKQPPPSRPPEPPAPPVRSSDDIPWQVSPEEVAPPPLLMPPPSVVPPAPPPPPRTSRSTPHTFRLLDEEAERKPAPKPKRRKRRGPWLKRVAILLVLAGAGAGGYWYLAIRNPGMLPGLLERAKQLVSRVTSRKSTASNPPAPSSRRRPTTSPQAAAPAPAPVPPQPPRPVPQAVTPQPTPPPPPASPFARFDRLSDSLTRAVRNFQDRAALFASGRMDCGGLATGLVAIENLWISYNTERRARVASFDPSRVARDQALWASVDSVSRRFDNSGCPRP
jgi:proteasome lid subunit RPN8/RPN11